MSNRQIISRAPHVTSTDGKIFLDKAESSLTVGSKTLAVKPEETTIDTGQIQARVDIISLAGGGVVTLRNGTYLMSGSLSIPSNVTFQGETAGGVIIDFQGAAYQILIGGSLVQSVGTVAVNNKATTVTGSGTSWTSALVGSYILLKGRWFLIDSVNSTTSITIDQIFDADSISGQTSYIADPVSGTSLTNLTVQNSTHASGAVYYQYANGCYLDGVNVYLSTIGLNFSATSIQNAVNFLVALCTTGVNISNSGVFTLYNYEIYGSSGANLVCDSFYNVSNSNMTISSAGGNNVTLTNCSSWGFYDAENTSAGGKGIEMTNCTDIQISSMAVRDATSDGIKLTSGCLRIGLASNVLMIKNGGWGFNIADASTDRSTVLGCSFNTNTSGTVQNNGTNTINVNNHT